eukprot:1372361-Amorphochlora_amoeboformis.AAC.1
MIKQITRTPIRPPTKAASDSNGCAKQKIEKTNADHSKEDRNRDYHNGDFREGGSGFSSHRSDSQSRSPRPGVTSEASGEADGMEARGREISVSSTPRSLSEGVGALSQGAVRESYELPSLGDSKAMYDMLSTVNSIV